MYRHPYRKIAVALTGILLPLGAAAVGLGQLQTFSSLGEPYYGEAELQDIAGIDLETIKVSAPPPEVYKQAGLEWRPTLTGFAYKIETNAAGKAVILIRSSRPINDPFIDLLLDVQWPSGKLLRQFTVLLDPPGYGNSGKGAAGVELPQAPASSTVPVKPALPAVLAPTPPSAKAESKPAPKMQAKAETPAGKPTAKAKAEAATGKPKEKSEVSSYTVKKGDTLFGIANSLKPEGIALEQMLVALFRANPDAFDGGNMNRLNAGSTLSVPSAANAGAVDPAAAVKEIRLQAKNWRSYRQKLAAAVEKAPAPAPGKETPAAKGKITAATEDKAVPPKAAGEDILKLSKGDAKKAQARLEALQDDATAREKKLAEAESRIAQLEKDIQKMRQLLEVKNTGLAKAEAEAKQPPAKPVETPKAIAAAKPAASPKPTEAPSPTATPAQPKEQAKPTEQAKPAETPKPVEQPKPTEQPKPAEQPKPSEKAKPATTPKPTPQTPKEEPVVAEPSLIGALLESPALIGAGVTGFILAVAGLLWGIGRLRRKKIKEFQDSVLSGSTLTSEPTKDKATGGTVNTDTSFLTDFSHGDLAPESNEVDPINEAEVYLAYGREPQAEEILKEALAKDPSRHDVCLRLLEIYAARKDGSAFETLASELYVSFEGQPSEVWNRAAELGRSIDPQNPLYANVGGGTPRSEASLEKTLVMPASALSGTAAGLGSDLMDLDLTLSDEPEGQPDIDLGAAGSDFEEHTATAAEEEEDMDFPLDFDTEEGVETIGGGESVDFDLGTEEAEETEQPAEIDVEAENEDDLGLEFDLSDILAEGDDTAPKSAGRGAADDGNAVDFDLSGLNLDDDLPTEAPPASSAPSVADDGNTMDFDLGDLNLDEETPASSIQPKEEEPASSGKAEADEDIGMNFDLGDLDLGEEAPAPAVQPKEEEPAPGGKADTDEGSAMDFDLGDLDLGEEAPAPEIQPMGEESASIGKTEADEDIGMNFDLGDLDLGEETPAPAVHPIEVEPAPALGGMADFDIGNLDLGDTEEEQPALAGNIETAESETGDSLDMNFDLGDLDFPEAEPAVPEAGAVEEEEDLLAGLDFGGLTVEEPEAAVPEELSLPEDTGDLLSEIDLDLGEGSGSSHEGPNFDLSAVEPPAKGADPEPGLLTEDDIDLDALDFGDDGESTDAAATDPRWQEAGTKLDLAMAYFDMGDKDGAREMAEEVLQNGNDKQRTDAQALLGRIEGR